MVFDASEREARARERESARERKRKRERERGEERRGERNVLPDDVGTSHLLGRRSAVHLTQQRIWASYLRP